MGVYLPNMEMPKSCWACACYHHKVDDGYYDYDVCQASGTVFNDGYASVTGHKTHIDPFKQRLDNCPLVPVPPHGRLIDADELTALVYANIALFDSAPGRMGAEQKLVRAWLASMVDDINDAPTIIPADGNLQLDNGNANNSEGIANKKGE